MFRFELGVFAGNLAVWGNLVMLNKASSISYPKHGPLIQAQQKRNIDLNIELYIGKSNLQSLLNHC